MLDDVVCGGVGWVVGGVGWVGGGGGGVGGGGVGGIFHDKALKCTIFPVLSVLDTKLHTSSLAAILWCRFMTLTTPTVNEFPIAS